MVIENIAVEMPHQAKPVVAIGIIDSFYLPIGDEGEERIVSLLWLSFDNGVTQ